MHLAVWFMFANPSLSSACSLDTGRLNPETYRLFEEVEKHYGIRIEYTFPDAQASWRVCV